MNLKWMALCCLIHAATALRVSTALKAFDPAVGAYYTDKLTGCVPS